MYKKYFFLISFSLFLMFCLNLNAQIQEKGEFGFTGEVKEFVLKKLHPRVEQQIVIDEKLILDKVEVLMVGFSSIKPTDVDFECFKFIDYYYSESIFDDWVALIAVNYGKKPAYSTIISIEVKGPKSTKIEIKRTIPRETAMLYTFKFNKKFSKETTGIYEFIGQIYHRKMWTSRAVTRLYIDDIW